MYRAATPAFPNHPSPVRRRLGPLDGKLSALERQSLELTYWRGLDQTEIAESLGTSAATIRDCIRSGLQRLSLYVHDARGDSLAQ